MRVLLTIIGIVIIGCSFPFEQRAQKAINVPGDRSLGTYNGSLGALFPESVGTFKKLSTPDSDKPPGHAGEGLQIKAAYFARYASNGTDDIWIKALNFASTNDAKNELRKACQKEEQVYDSARNVTEWKTTDLVRRAKIINSVTVGERCESFFLNGPATGILGSVVWTNGSVLFLLDPDPSKHNTTYPQRASAILAFERNFRY